MKAISLDEPWATLCVLRPSCLTCRNTRKMGVRYPGEHGGEMGAEYDEVDCDACPDAIKWIETRSWPAPANAIGETIAIHATKRPPDEGLRLGGFTVIYDMQGTPMLWFDEPFADVGEGDLHGVNLSPGHVVGTAQLADSLQMLSLGTHIERTGLPFENEPEFRLLCSRTTNELQLAQWTMLDDDPERFGWDFVDISAQYPFGWYEPGRWGWLLENARSTWELCPSCLGDEAKTCVRCMGRLTCPPVPARGFQRVWGWEDTAP